MPFLIDGHNLIPKLGLRLDSFDDEVELINKLNEFCRITRKTLQPLERNELVTYRGGTLASLISVRPDGS